MIEVAPRMSTSGRGDSIVLDQDTSTTTTATEETGVKLFVAVGKEYKDSESTLIWAIQNNLRVKTLVLIHVHRPGRLIPMMGGWFLPSQLEKEQVEAYKKLEKSKINKALEEYALVCESVKIATENLVIEMEDVAKGLIEAIEQHAITRLVMGAAADKYYSKKMTAPKSKTASSVQKGAPSFCNVFFVCKGNLVCTREATVEGYGRSQSSMASPSAQVAQTEQLRSGLSSQSSRLSNVSQDLFNHSSRSSSADSFREKAGPLAKAVPNGTTASKSFLYGNEEFIDLQEGVRRGSEGTGSFLKSRGDNATKMTGFNAIMDNEGSAEGSPRMLHSEQKSEEDITLTYAGNQMDDSTADDFYTQLQQALLESAKLKDEAHEESLKRRRAEMELLDANRRAKASELKCAKEMKLRKEIEETLAKERVELEKLKSQRDEFFEELQTESNHVVKDFEGKLSEAHRLLCAAQRERDDAIRELGELRQQMREGTSSITCRSPSFSEFSCLELEEATHNFQNSLKIGVGGYGSVFKGFLRHMPVAIKMLHSQSLKGQTEFHQEVEVLSRVRHPNLVTLIGACPEAWALIYEFLPNGSLEDRLSRKGNTPPLPWQARIRISVEICSALLFLHSHKPHGLVHGDLRPANILLDANFVSKVTDFGISRFIKSNTNTIYHWTDPNGSFVYLDPEFFSTGDLTTCSDIYSYGIILLRLLTGRPALGNVREVHEALERGRPILDPLAGNWPLVQAQQLVHLALWCCEMNRKNRPDLVRDVWKILEPMENVALLEPSSTLESEEEEEDDDEEEDH